MLVFLIHDFSLMVGSHYICKVKVWDLDHVEIECHSFLLLYDIAQKNKNGKSYTI